MFFRPPNNSQFKISFDTLCLLIITIEYRFYFLKTFNTQVYCFINGFLLAVRFECLFQRFNRSTSQVFSNILKKIALDRFYMLSTCCYRPCVEGQSSKPFSSLIFCMTYSLYTCTRVAIDQGLFLSFNSGLERFWMRAFMCLFMDYYVQGYLWTLTPTDKPPKDDDKGFPWNCFIQMAKVRFNCPVIKQKKNCQLYFNNLNNNFLELFYNK
jgi:hypothetical protein